MITGDCFLLHFNNAFSVIIKLPKLSIRKQFSKNFGEDFTTKLLRVCIVQIKIYYTKMS